MSEKTKIIRHRLRKKDIDIAFKEYPPSFFDKGLEIGAGDGFQSQFIKRYVKHLICTEYYKERLREIKHIDGIEYKIADANYLSDHFNEKEYNLIYSSNVLEHLSKIENVLDSMRRILKDDGIMIHIMPNRLWKILHIAMWYLRYPKKIKKKLSRKKTTNKKKRQTLINNPKKVLNNDIIKSKLNKFFPKPHGIEQNNYREFLAFGQRAWKSVFQNAGFEILQIRKLQFHTPYRYGFESGRRLLTQLGICSSYAYYLKKK